MKLVPPPRDPLDACPRAAPSQHSLAWMQKMSTSRSFRKPPKLPCRSTIFRVVGICESENARDRTQSRRICTHHDCMHEIRRCEPSDHHPRRTKAFMFHVSRRRCGCSTILPRRRPSAPHVVHRIGYVLTHSARWFGIGFFRRVPVPFSPSGTLDWQDVTSRSPTHAVHEPIMIKEREDYHALPSSV